MIRFSCFNPRTQSHKPKKTADLPAEAVHKTVEEFSQIQAPQTLARATSSILPKAQANNHISNDVKDVICSLSAEQSWNSDKIEDKMNVKNDIGVHQMGLFRKSKSLGSGLCHEGRVLSDNDTEEDDKETDQGYHSDSIDQNGLLRPDGLKNTEISPASEHEKYFQLESVQMSSDFVEKQCTFSIGDPQHSERDGLENFDAPSFGEACNLPGNRSPHSPPMMADSCSMPDMVDYAPNSHRYSNEYPATYSRSSEDLHALVTRWKTISIDEIETQEMREQGRGDNVPKTEEHDFESCLHEGFDSYNYSALAKDWIMPVGDEVNMTKNLQRESSIQQWEELPGGDFKMKRIEDWVHNLQHHGSLEETLKETNELSRIDDPVKGESNNLTSAKFSNKVTPGMESAERYISSLTVSATTAHLANHGLAVIPFLIAFDSLRMLNLSGNSIVRITAGALPRGLHMLNLSKNNISTIEGLRELTRLRVLDLSYNRIVKIGHGLASCTSLKELYLAGNKISEVEGLHRMLKLTLLDLRFNKISTAKCLDQLAANYNSLQAISLEGNPAQKNVGDEQLKKYLQGLLPHLVYFNRHPIKASTSKDSADRSVRLAITAHQYDRGFRSDNKAARKGSHGLAGSRPSSSSTYDHKSKALISTKQITRRPLLPPSRTKAINHHHIDLGRKLLNFRSEFSFHKSRSEGNLGIL